MAGKSSDGTNYLFVCFRLLGILIPEKKRVLYVIYSTIVNTLSVIALPLGFTLSYTIAKMPLNQLLTSLQLAINVHACIVKFIIIALKRRKMFRIKMILDQLDEDVAHPDDEHEIQKVIKFSRVMVILYCFAYYSYAVVTFFGAAYNGIPPYSLYNPFFDWRTSRSNFIMQTLIECILINIACLQDVANDSFAVIYIRILHTQVRVLIKSVSRIGSDPNATQQDNLRQLVHCIGNHRKLIELSDSVAAVISTTTFVQFLTSSVALGTTLINIKIFANRSTIIASVVFIGGLVWEVLPMCYFMDSLMAEAARLPDVIFHSNWMDQNKAFQRNCIFFMHRSQKPMVFFAGKIFPITLETFIAIIKFAFSFYTLLSTMDLADRFNHQ